MGNIRLVKEGRSKGEVESAIRNAVIKFEQEFMGRGPDDVRAFIVRDIILDRLKGVLTPAERQLAKTQDGVEMVKRLRQNLIAQGRDKLCEQMSNITGGTVTALYTDIDTQIGERIIVFTLDQDLEATFQYTVPPARTAFGPMMGLSAAQAGSRRHPSTPLTQP